MTQKNISGPVERARGGLIRLAAFVSILAAATVSFDAAAQTKRMQVIGAGRLLSVEVKKGRLVRIPKPAATVFIADPAIADIQVKSPTLLYIFGKKAGETTLFAVDDKDKILLNLTVKVNHNLTSLSRTLRGVLPGVHVRVRTVGDAVILSGTVKSNREAEDVRKIAEQYVANDKKVINQLQVRGPNQVNLRVRIVEMSRNVTRNLGINWDAAFQFGSNFAIGMFTGAATTVASQAFPPAGVGLVNRRNGLNNFVASYNGQRRQFNAVLDALEGRGLVKTLAEPNLTALSGETASFLAGGEFPIPVPQDGGVITVTFKKFGVGLAFTPTILDDGRISLKVNPEVSQLSSAGAIQIQGISVPSLTTRRASTTIELGSGQSFAIAGLLQNNLSKDVSKVPGLGEVPVLGKLFTSENYRKDESELVIIVTPYIVRPFNTQNASTGQQPARAVPKSSERDITRLFLGRNKKSGAKPQESRVTLPPRPNGPPKALKGPAGFELE
jgi:pilus assembly protein CpaC